MEPILRAGAFLYGAAQRARGAAYDLGLRPTRRVDGLTVVSVGGIRAGGDGKTPLALHLALRLQAAGRSTAVVSRGYRGRWERAGGVVEADRLPLTQLADLAGDEAAMVARRAPELIVVVGADRVAAAEQARALGAEVAVLDSGFQHRRLARDLDIATVSWPLDPTERLLPAGLLREPPSALDRADLVGYATSGDGPPPTDSPRAFTYHLAPDCLVDSELAPTGPADGLAGTRVLLISGIARSERFVATVESQGADIVGSHAYPDHYRFSPRDRRRLVARAGRRGADLVLTTEKDLVRLGKLDGPEVAALRVGVKLDAGAKRLDEAVGRARRR